jgi:hypothetical protein
MGKFDMKISVNEMKTVAFKWKQCARCENVLRSEKQKPMRMNLKIYKIYFCLLMNVEFSTRHVHK